MKEYDFLIIGSGFGGSVAAMRLAQKGYKVALLEMGKAWKANDFPKTNWNIKKYLWAPLIRCFGIQKISLLNKVMVLHGTGLGGGSLVYANTLLKPPPFIFDSPLWPKNVQWKTELDPFYETAKRMLGVTTNTIMGEGEKGLEKIYKRGGVQGSLKPTEVGVYFGDPSKEEDPYFSGKGPKRKGCTSCGACMIGCPHNAKNTLDKNYLYFAQSWGVEIFPETKAEKIIPQENFFKIETKKTCALFNKKGQVFKSKKVILAAGVLGTLDLLLRNKEEYKTLPNLSNQLGEIVRTNGESLLGSTSLKSGKDYSKGIAIGAKFNLDKNTTIENVRYPSGSNFIKLLAVPLTGPGNLFTRPLKMLGNIFFQLPQLLKLWFIRDWASRSIILLVMQSIDNKIALKLKRSPLNFFRKGLQSVGVKGEEIPSFFPEAQKACKELAEDMEGMAQNCMSEVVAGIPATAHILGGAVLGNDSETGVVSSNFETFGHPNLFVCDGSVIPVNLSVNPSLTITALAEKFVSQFPDLSTEEEKKEREVHFSNI